MVLLSEQTEKKNECSWMFVKLPENRPLTPEEKQIEENLCALWELRLLAQASNEAQELEKSRDLYIKELYEDIGCSKSHWGHDGERQATPSTEVQAICIIIAKERYEKRIQKLKKKYYKWRSALKFLTPFESKMIRNYLELNQTLDDEVAYTEIERIAEKLLNTVF